MKVRHAEQVEKMIGKKVKIYVSGKKVERVLRRDSEGLYIRYDNERVSVRPDENTLDVLCFLALSPKNTAAIKRMREARATKSEQVTSGDSEVVRETEQTIMKPEQDTERKVIPLNTFRVRQLRKAYEDVYGRKLKDRTKEKPRVKNSIPP